MFVQMEMGVTCVGLWNRPLHTSLPSDTTSIRVKITNKINTTILKWHALSGS